jgi:hypothetical protein
MEVMATSDNVVRAGLTPKFKDVDTLVDMLTYAAGVPAVLTGEAVDAHTRAYPAPVPEFLLQCTTLTPTDGAYTLPPIPSGAVVIVVKGAGVATVHTEVTLTGREGVAGPQGFANDAGEVLVAPKPLGWSDTTGSTAPPPVAMPPASARGTPGARGGIPSIGTNGPASGQLSARGTPRAADSGRTGVIGGGAAAPSPAAAAGAGSSGPSAPASPAAPPAGRGVAAATQALAEGTVWFQPAHATVTITVGGAAGAGGGAGGELVLYRSHANA